MSYIPNRTLFLASAAAALLVLLALAGCALGSAPAPTPTPPPPTATPLPRGGNLTIGIAADITALRPWQPRSRGEEQAISLLYNGLMRIDRQLRPQPDLAQRWEASADGRLITFTLRPDVTWHDGRPLTSEDAAFTLGALQALSPTTTLQADLRRIAEISAPTTSTLVISLTERYAPLLAELTLPILPKHLLDGRALDTLNFWEVPVGSGPFKLEARQPGASITLEANQSYYRGQPLLDRVALLVAPNDQIAREALADGRLLLAEPSWQLSQALPQAVPSLQSGSYPENGYYFLAFNTREGRPFADARVRQALAQVLDLPALVRDVTGGRGIPIGNSAAPGSWADLVPPVTSTAALTSAATLLDQAGWRSEGGAIRQREGVPLAAQILVRGDDPRRVAAAQRITAAARTVGVSLTVQPADFDTVIRAKYAPPYDFDLLLGSWSNGAGDPSFADYMYYDPDDFALFHSSQVNQGVADTRPVLNITGFRDPVYDNQAAAAQQLYDLDARAQAIQQAQQRIAELKPYLYLWADRFPVVLSQRITTLDGPVDLNTPQYLGDVERWYLKP